jgi:DtxR family Mn-dependent transcriptional regulator
MRKKTIEDYVKLIFTLETKNKKVHTNDIASLLDIAPSSVTEIFQKLSDEDYINYEKYCGVTLTEKGKKIAVRIKKKYDVLKNFLITLGVAEDIADKDACKIEHVVTPETMHKLTKFVKMFSSQFSAGSKDE